MSLTINKKYLFFRNEIDDLKNLIYKENSKTVCLDFSKVSFFSRSFGDELLNTTEDFEREKIKIKIINLKPQLKFFLEKIRRRKEKIRKEMK